MTALHTLSATDLLDLIRSKQLSPVDLVRASLDRAERLQDDLNCFITLCGEQALDRAREVEQAIMQRKSLGRLHGIPYTVKDLVNTAGVRTTFGTLLYQDNVPTEDAPCVARLNAEGAILIGKTTTPEFGSQPFTRSPLFGQTRNAWSAERTSGGSSGGAAVATAAGITPLAIATDGGGSTRIPAACNGVVGIKQSNGVIPHSQAQDLFGNQTYVTPMTRTVADTGLMLQVMSGDYALDPWSIGLKRGDYCQAARYQGDLRGKRIRYCYAPQGRAVSAEVRQYFDLALQRLVELGAALEPFEAQDFIVEPIWRTINHTVWRTRFLPLVERHGDTFSPTFRQQILSAGTFSAGDYQEAMFARTTLFKRIQALFDAADLFVTPTITRTALPLDMDLFDPIDIDGEQYDGIRTHWYPWTMVFNMTGHPAVTLPCGLASDGLPVGIQFVTRYGADEDLLRFASAFENVMGQAPQPVL
ncbi:amidase [Pusillimonas sp. SM2304]|uniref:amidase n=1 Tax=Pusillimonas sp. SM2304 TaxID=3073241 RepID=UPI002876623A|nr:amidase [Pusillimonas sp. SM2304]MDS1139933.1 amidase [Pusillimonas sp. SM2304]